MRRRERILIEVLETKKRMIEGYILLRDDNGNPERVLCGQQVYFPQSDGVWTTVYEKRRRKRGAENV